jgi:hypothetical protein
MPFQEDDIVTRVRNGNSRAANMKLESGRLGRICSVVVPGSSYLVRFEGISICVMQFEDSLRAAAGDAPRCVDHPSCRTTD